MMATVTNGVARHDDEPKFGRATDLLLEHGVHGVEDADAIAAEQIEWRWEGYIARDSVAFVGGRPSEGKTTAVCVLAVAAAAPPDAPVKVLGRVVRPVDDDQIVVLVLEENSRKSAVTQIDRAIEALGLDREHAWSRIVLLPRCGVRGRRPTPEEMRALSDVWCAVLDRVRAGQVGLLVVDSLARVFRASDSNSEKDQAEIGALLTDIVEHGATVIVIVHVRKNGGGAIELEDIAGHHQRAAVVDSVIAIEGAKKKRLTYASKFVLLKQREITDDAPEPRTMTLARVDDRWSIAESTSVEDDEGKPAHERVADLLAGGEKTKREVREALGMSGATLESALTKLFEAKRVAKSKKLVGKRDVDVLSLRAPPAKRASGQRGSSRRGRPNVLRGEQ